MHYALGADRSPLVNVGVLVATFAIAEMSYRWVETPIRRYGFRGSANRVVAAFQSSRTKFLPVSVALAVVVAAASTGARAMLMKRAAVPAAMQGMYEA